MASALHPVLAITLHAGMVLALFLQAPAHAADNGETLMVGEEMELPVSRWAPQGEPERVVLGLHGFNDFRESFAVTGEALREDGTLLVAYDQRGFGETDNRGEWPGAEQLLDDALGALERLRQRYPDTPIYLMGESMGAAIAMLALAREDTPADGGILLAPAVWGRDVQPWYQRLGLWLGEQVHPSGRLSTEWLDIHPSDDPETMRYWQEHPLVIREPSIKALAGLGELMDRARLSAGRQSVPVLMLYGGQDELVPKEAVCRMLRGFEASGQEPWRFAFYPRGWHFLTRDRRAEETLADIRAWLRDHQATLPSDRELTREEMAETVCPP